ncbi:hypothetical protein E2C01_090596 [Portunus trituberculatus]|uniref:Uncharacterized protein n=1 Tax=Portunus trituberculatus TaxID=210409 RepID=A0A5B7JQJ0_PORTR|nr:hypothetical protein [Portunus trituberculatus]
MTELFLQIPFIPFLLSNCLLQFPPLVLPLVCYHSSLSFLQSFPSTFLFPLFPFSCSPFYISFLLLLFLLFKSHLSFYFPSSLSYIPRLSSFFLISLQFFLFLTFIQVLHTGMRATTHPSTFSDPSPPVSETGASLIAFTEEGREGLRKGTGEEGEEEEETTRKWVWMCKLTKR